LNSYQSFKEYYEAVKVKKHPKNKLKSHFREILKTANFRNNRRNGKKMLINSFKKLINN